jgi:hypothetical protein
MERFIQHIKAGLNISTTISMAENQIVTGWQQLNWPKILCTKSIWME